MAGSGTSTAGLTVVQATAANLNATVVQGTASNLQVEPNQATAADLNATVTPVSWLFSVEMAVGTTVVKSSAGQLHGVLIETNKTTDVNVQLFNYATASATNPMTPNMCVAGGDNLGGAMGIDCAFSLGCVIVISGTGGVVTVYYR